MNNTVMNITMNNTVMNTIIYNTFMHDKTLFDNFYKNLSKCDKIKMMCSIFIGEKITIKQFKTGLKEITNITLTELFEDKVIEYLYKTCDRKDAGDGTSYYVPNENYKKIFTAFLEVYGCKIDYHYEYDNNEYGWDECDIFNKYYDEPFNNINMLKIYVDYIIKNKAQWDENIKSFVRTIYYMIHSLHDNIIKYIFEEFEKKKAIRNIFIECINSYDFIARVCEGDGNLQQFMIKRLFTHKYKVNDFEEFFDNFSNRFVDGKFMKECFRKMTKISHIQLADILVRYSVSHRDEFMDNIIFIYMIKASIRLKRHMNVSNKMQKMKKNKDKFLANYFIQLGVMKQHRHKLSL